MFFIALTIISVYTLLILIFFAGWLSIPNFNCKTHNRAKISLLIPFRNEAENLPRLLQSLENQNINKNDVQIILINDNSTDKSVEIIKNFIKDKTNYKLLHSNGQGKKTALLTGIAAAENDLLVTTDADCTFSDQWLKNIQCFDQNIDFSMLLIPVFYNTGGINHFFKLVQNLELISLQAITAGSAGLKNAVSANGAALVFKKHILNYLSDPYNNKIASGDDIFLLFAVKKQNRKKIFFIKNPKTYVKTKSNENLKNFLRQRVRWASKTRYYTDKFTIFTGFITFAANLSLVIASLFFINHSHYFLILWLIKTTPETLITHSFSKYYSQKFNLIIFLAVSLIYPFYVILTAILAMFLKYEWKGREFKF